MIGLSPTLKSTIVDALTRKKIIPRRMISFSFHKKEMRLGSLPLGYSDIQYAKANLEDWSFSLNKISIFEYAACKNTCKAKVSFSDPFIRGPAADIQKINEMLDNNNSSNSSGKAIIFHVDYSPIFMNAERSIL